MKIAIVDDSLNARDTLSKILRLVGFETFIVGHENGRIDQRQGKAN